MSMWTAATTGLFFRNLVGPTGFFCLSVAVLGRPPTLRFTTDLPTCAFRELSSSCAISSVDWVVVRLPSLSSGRSIVEAGSDALILLRVSMIGVSGLVSALRLNECCVIARGFESESAGPSALPSAAISSIENVLLKGEYVAAEVLLRSHELAGEGGFALGGIWEKSFDVLKLSTQAGLLGDDSPRHAGYVVFDAVLEVVEAVLGSLLAGEVSGLTLRLAVAGGGNPFDTRCSAAIPNGSWLDLSCKKDDLYL
jgi:hypothetical protein